MSLAEVEWKCCFPLIVTPLVQLNEKLVQEQNCSELERDNGRKLAYVRNLGARLFRRRAEKIKSVRSTIRERKPAPTFIVPPQSLLTAAQVAEEKWTYCDLAEQCTAADAIKVLEWLAKRRLIRNAVTCKQCQQPYRLQHRTGRIDKFQWAHGGCRKSQSLREGSFFSRSHLSLHSLIRLMYGWAHGYPQHRAMTEAGLGDSSEHTAVDWFQFFRDICQQWCRANPSQVEELQGNSESLVDGINATQAFQKRCNFSIKRGGHRICGSLARGSSITAEKKLKRIFKTSAELLPSYLCEFIWREHVQGDPFASFLTAIAQFYPV
ncbi:hypothetical protein AB6A40_001748 [Gnathostoma spinigerum]|uniref:Uncharacterized protein n=1 Tax=Gnathostoma spinigerum TaxID=75299 RepID=A0ABD6EA65_9BILA